MVIGIEVIKKFYLFFRFLLDRLRYMEDLIICDVLKIRE